MKYRFEINQTGTNWKPFTRLSIQSGIDYARKQIQDYKRVNNRKAVVKIYKEDGEQYHFGLNRWVVKWVEVKSLEIE